YTYYRKYGINEFAGGGRASARETVSWVVGGALCRQWLERIGISVKARFVETNSVKEAAANGDSTGGIVEGEITGLPVGVGEPVFGKLHSRLAAAMMGINAAKAFEYGDGFKAAYSLGSESADLMFPDEERPGEYLFKANHSGGIQGGISNGMPINFRVYFKPTPTLMREMYSYDISGQPITIPPKGRHDPCVAIRGVAVVEAMALLTIADLMK
ncbi:MAG: chorismate synthase, partial [Muribaculaceae bacterium]|nr:chorismate synthase [Muribaculaceae bacterium]